MTKAELESKHIAELHELAADAGIERYRMLKRDDLVAALAGKGADGKAAAEDEGERPGRSERSGRERGRDSSARRGRRRRGGRRSRSATAETGGESESEGDPRSRAGDAEGRDGGDQPEAQSIHGLFEPAPDGGGAVGDGTRRAQVTPAQVKRCELRPGDEVEGPVKPAKGGRLSLVRIEQVNGADPEVGRPPAFEDLAPVTPTRRIPLELAREDVLTRATDLLAPLAFGQRVLVRAEPRSGRTSLLRGLAKAIAAGPAQASVAALLIDERPEEVSAWKEEAPEVMLHAAPADMLPAEQVGVAERAMGRAKRRAEAGEDVVLLIDSLTRLAVAYDDPAVVKRFFGAGRDLAGEGAGSLTVIAIALTGSDEGAAVTRAVETTESTSLDLSASLAAEGIVPALIAIRPAVAGEELLREGDELQAARRLRAELRLLPAEEAARSLAERIEATATNEELLAR